MQAAGRLSGITSHSNSSAWPQSPIAVSLMLLLLICLLNQAAALGSSCSLLDSSCFNLSRCSRGFTFYIHPLRSLHNNNTVPTTAAPHTSLPHRCQRIMRSTTTDDDNMETWAAECLVFVISEYFQVGCACQLVCMLVRYVCIHHLFSNLSTTAGHNEQDTAAHSNNNGLLKTCIVCHHLCKSLFIKLMRRCACPSLVLTKEDL